MRLPVIVCLLVSAVAAAQERPLPDMGPFAAKVRAKLEDETRPMQSYMYVETRRELRYDGDGRATSEKVEVFESYPGLPGESRWLRKISENGQPVPAAKLEQQDRDQQREVEEFQRARARETAKDREKRERKREREKRETARLLDDAFQAYDIRMIGREKIDGYDTILFTLTPKPQYKPITPEGKYFRRVKGKVWVSESEYEIVWAEGELIETISIGAGLLARLHEGTTVSFQRRKVNGEAWLPARIDVKGSARLLLLKRLRMGSTQEFSGYRKFGVNTSETYWPVKPPPPH